MAGQHRQRIEYLLRNKVWLLTDFSGTGGPETAMDLMADAMVLAGLHVPADVFQSWRSGDIDPGCQALLLRRPCCCSVGREVMGW